MMRSDSPQSLDDEALWQAVKMKDRRQDGLFVFAVRTTGIYCRPSCPARTPLRRNVSFFSSPPLAEAAGYRACLRCHPAGKSSDLQRSELVARACREIEASEESPSLSSLAKSVGLSPHHFHRIFKEITGLTPKAYADALRSEKTRRLLPTRATVTEAIYEAGFQSSGRFYAASSQMLGMKPETYQKQGGGMQIRFALAPCSLGYVLAAATAKGLCAIFLGDEPSPLQRDLKQRFSAAELIPAGSDFQKLLRQVVALIERPDRASRLPLDIRGTVFQCRVWEELRKIPPGSTATYTEIARRLGMPDAVRAVAGACAANTLAVAIPCHRVKRQDGSLSGYRWGVRRKKALLEKEAGA